MNFKPPKLFFKRNAQYLLLGILFLLSLNLMAQKTMCYGIVTDAKTGVPLPYVNIGFADSKIGTISDEKGNYSLETYYSTKEITASFVGYNPQTLSVLKDKKQELNFSLAQERVNLGEVVIRPDKDYENPAHVIMRRIIAHKSSNNREKLNTYEYALYNKVEIDMDQPRKQFVNFFLFKPIDFIFDNIDSTSEETPFLPMLLSESVSEFHYRKSPKSRKEYVSASKISGVQNESVTKLLGDMYQNVNIYNNKILIFDRSFVSPLSDNGLIHYRYYLTDSAFIDDKWCYQLQFQPRRKQELTFKGYFWVNDTTYAIKKIEAKMAKDANINFITNFQVNQEYKEVQKEVWMLSKDELRVNARILAPHNGRYHRFIGRKTTTYKDFKINRIIPDSIFETEMIVTLSDSAQMRSDAEWVSCRHNPLSVSELSVYNLVDTVKSTMYYKVWSQVLRGYFRYKYIEIGPYFGMYSFNAIEGDRLKLSVRSSKHLNPDLRLNTYAAYGFFDQQWKYGFSARYFISRHPRQYVKFSYKKDLEQLGIGSSVLGQDNLLASASRITSGNMLNGVEEMYGVYERTWSDNITTTVKFNNRRIWALGNLEFNKLDENNNLANIGKITTTELLVGIHYGFLERFMETAFSRISLGSNYPVLDAQYSYGFKGFMGGDYEYHKVVLTVSQKVRLGILGTTKYKIQGGKIYGTLPYPILELHNGNETYFFNDNSFTLMNYYEFASDQYVSLFLEHHFEGFFFNKIPLLKKLKLREVVSGKAVMGSLSAKHNSVLVIPETTFSLTEPYMEVAVGIENILNSMRVDAIWRLTQLDNPGVVQFGIRTKFQIGF